MSYLVLERNQPGRRAGLTRNGYKRPPLHETVAALFGDERHTMSSLGATVRNRASDKIEKKEEDVMRPPESTTDEDSSDVEYNRANIKHSTFRVQSEPPEILPEEKIELSHGKNKDSISTTEESRIKGKTVKRSISSKSKQTSPKFQKLADLSKLGSGMADGFGMVNVKKRKTVYGSNSLSAVSSQKSKRGFSKESHRKNIFKAPPKFDPPPDLDEDLSPTFKVAELPNFDSPAPSPAKLLGFRVPDASMTLEEDEDDPFSEPKYRGFSVISGIEDSPVQEILPGKTASRGFQNRESLDGFPATQLPTFQTYNLGDDLGESMDEILMESRTLNRLPFTLTPHDVDFTSSSPTPSCPMCGAPIDSVELAQYQRTTTRQQEKICRAHQRRTALQEWSAKGYPEIDWDRLKDRIPTHHAFIEHLVNGCSSYYRDLLEETINAGRDRNLLKMESSLTPGYYGPRGLLIMTENIMDQFTPLLKKRIVTDRAIAARGVTGFVQSVLVPEVAVLLIGQDMGVSIEDARAILTESVAIGELLSDEVVEVFVRQVEDSEDDDDED